MAGGEDYAEGGQLVIDESGVYGGRFVATEAGFVVEEIAETEEGTFDTLVVGVAEEEAEDEEKDEV
jgi:hypothetical protein